eukprot:scaffold27292_cov50-Phaeocystis_antarctica.AAC.2
MAILAMAILAMAILAMAILTMAILTIGEMHDAAGLATLEAITRLPYHEQSGAGGTIMRLLDAELPATAAIVGQLRSDELTESRGQGTATDSATAAMNTEL